MRYFICLSAFVILSSCASAKPTVEVLPTKPVVAKVEVQPKEKVQKQAGMTLERMIEIVRSIDEKAEVSGNAMRITVAGVTVTIITDPKSNRMRAFVAIQTLDGVDQALLHRLMQANFDSALDARYAIAQEHILSVFIHPLKELTDEEFIVGVGQVINLVKTFGTSYTSGALIFGGGDSQNLHRKLIDKLLQKGRI